MFLQMFINSKNMKTHYFGEVASAVIGWRFTFLLKAECEALSETDASIVHAQVSVSAW